LEVSAGAPYLFNVALFGTAGFGLEIKENDYGYLHGEITLTTDVGPRWRAGLALKAHEISDSSGGSGRFEGLDFVATRESRPYRAGLTTLNADFKVGSGIVQRSGRQLTRWHVDLAAGGQIPFSFRHAVVGKVVCGTILSDKRDTLRGAELYRTGGYKSLRGYGDDEFTFRTVAYGQAEYHLYFKYSGSVFIFMDAGMGFDRDARVSVRGAHRLMGYGSGIRIPVRIGDASIEWARNYKESSGWGRLHVAVSNTQPARRLLKTTLWPHLQ
jgi:hypothetical protein